MRNREIRMRCIEALSSMGVRETQRLIVDASKLEEWVLAAEPDAVPETEETLTPVAMDKEDESPTSRAAEKAGKARKPR
jgi:hypothetical protein